MKKHIILSLIIIVSYVANAQNSMHKAYINLANEFLLAMKNKDYNKYKKFYATYEEFDDYKEKKVSRIISRDEYYKRGFDEYYTSYEELVKRDTPNYQDYKKKLDKEYESLYLLDNRGNRDYADWKNSTIEYIYIKRGQGEINIVLNNRQYYYIINIETAIFKLKNIYYHNELRFMNGYDEYHKIGNKQKFDLLWNKVKNSNRYEIVFERKENNSDMKNQSIARTGKFIDNRDGHSYKWVKIGKQVWMSENLAYTGNDIKHITDDKEWNMNNKHDGWCYFNNNVNFSKTYGILYQWEAAKKACPSGWHLPSFYEWKELYSYLKNNGYSCDGIKGGKKISKALARKNDWIDSNSKSAIGSPDCSEYINKSGFSALPVGSRRNGGSFTKIGIEARWWLDTRESPFSAFTFDLNQTKMDSHSSYMAFGICVRCIKD